MPHPGMHLRHPTWPGTPHSAKTHQALGSVFAARFARRAAAQPSFVTWCARATVSDPAGTSFVMHDPAPMYDPSSTLTGATSVESLPTNTSLPIRVRCLVTPS